MLNIKPLTKDIIVKRFEGELIGMLSLESNFEIRTHNKLAESKADSHVRRYITLKENVPVINSITCGSGYSKAARILGITGTVMKALANFEYAYDDAKKVVLEIGECTKPIYNGAAIERLIDEVDAESIITHLMCSIIVKCVGKNFVVEIGRGSEYVDLYGDFGFLLKDKNGKVVDDYNEYVIVMFRRRLEYKDELFTRLNVILNLYLSCGNDSQKVRDYLKSVFIVRNVTVIPYNLRPSMGGKRHPLTALYQKLFQANTDVAMYSDSSSDEFKEHYKRIAQLVETLMCNNKVSGELSNIDPLLSRLKSKDNGIVRANMLKKRQDYSGRSAVIVNPFLPINTIGVPKSMVVRLYRRYLTSECGIDAAVVMEKINDPDFEEEAIKALVKTGIIDRIPALLGRNPTLHKHGIQGFKVVLVDGRAIQVSPLVCPAYNMDFDGDTSHIEVPITFAAVNELLHLIMTDKNIILPKTGESTICPEKDIVYGLYMCTRDDYTESGNGGRYNTITRLKQALYSQQIMVWDTVTLAGVGTGPAGRIAYKACFPKALQQYIDDVVIAQKSLRKYVDTVVGMPVNVFDDCLNALVDLGMRIAYLYNKSVSLLTPMRPVKEFDEAIDNFYKDMEPLYELNDLGLYDVGSFSYDLSGKISTVNDAMKNNVYAKMPDNMFKDMAQSGARGNESNLVQMFGCKGQISKNEVDSFNILITNSMQSQLTPMESSIAGYGARKGQISKSIKTADTGYMGRKLEHCSGSIMVTEDNCGTDKGVDIKFDEIRSFLIKETTIDSDMAKINEEAENIMSRFISGRCPVGSSTVITKSKAKELSASHGVVKIRSPLTCGNPCCKLCYGIDPSTGTLPKRGTPVGMLSALSMSEPLTQFVMKVFQKGGVVGAASPFDRLADILNQSDIRYKAVSTGYTSYDPVAWAPGTLEAEPFSNGQILLKIIPDEGVDIKRYNYKDNRIVSDMVEFKLGRHVEVGEQLRVERGDCYMRELLRCTDLETASLTMVYTLYFLYKSQVDLLPVHLELMVSTLIGYLPCASHMPDVRYGKYYQKHLLIELGYGDRLNEFIPEIRGVTSIVKGNPNFMEAFIMEDQREALSEALTNRLFDTNSSPLVQLALGQHVKVGTGYDSNFLEM